MLPTLTLISTIFGMVIFFGTQTCESGNIRYSTTITLHSSENYNHSSRIQLNLDVVDYYDFQKIGVASGKEIKAVTIDRGSCVEIHVNKPPAVNDDSKSGKTWAYLTKDQQKMPTLQGKASFVRSCLIQNTKRVCPAPFYVMSMAWNFQNFFSDGMEIGCQRPEDTTVVSKQWTKSFNNFPFKYNCGPNELGYVGFYITWDKKLERVTFIEPRCTDEGIPFRNEHTQDQWTFTKACREGEILTGIDIDVENYSNIVKGIYPICAAPNIGTDCVPVDKLTQVTKCGSPTATSRGNVTCMGIQTVGTTEKLIQSEEHSRQSMFYKQFGFDVGIQGKKLSANVGTSIKGSDTTGYNWGNATEDAFTKSVSYTVKAETYRGWETTLYQVTAQCGFLEARPNYFKRVDKQK